MNYGNKVSHSLLIFLSQNEIESHAPHKCEKDVVRNSYKKKNKSYPLLQYGTLFITRIIYGQSFVLNQFK